MSILTAIHALRSMLAEHDITPARVVLESPEDGSKLMAAIESSMLLTERIIIDFKTEQVLGEVEIEGIKVQWPYRQFRHFTKKGLLR